MRLVLVYNADSGWFNAFADSFHKLVSPETYSCSLCSLTHGLAGMKNEVREYLNTLEPDPVFYHRNEIPGDLRSLLDTVGGAPAVFLCKNDSYHVLFGVKELKQLNTSAGFLSELEAQLRLYA